MTLKVRVTSAKWDEKGDVVLNTQITLPQSSITKQEAQAIEKCIAEALTGWEGKK